MQEKQVIEYFQQNEGLMELRGPIFEEKGGGLHPGDGRVSEKPVSKDDLFKMPEDEDAA